MSGGADQTVKLWDVGTGQCIRTLCGRSNGIWAVAFFPGGKNQAGLEKILASVSDDQTVRLWDISSGKAW